jgi:hypothetical protein
MFSPAFWVVDLLESGVTEAVSTKSRTGWIRTARLTLLAGLLAESLAHGVRHVDCWLGS